MTEVTHSISKKEKPMFLHALIQGSLAMILAVFLSSVHAWDMTAQMAYHFLKIIGIDVYYVPSTLKMNVKLLDGTIVEFLVLLECSGLVTVGIFALISTFTIGLLRGKILTKLGWFLLSIGVGILWNVNRVVLVIAIAYNFGLAAFSFVHYLVGPSIDFIWIVSMWSIGASWLKRGETSL